MMSVFGKLQKTPKFGLPQHWFSDVFSPQFPGNCLCKKAIKGSLPNDDLVAVGKTPQWCEEMHETLVFPYEMPAHHKLQVRVYPKLSTASPVLAQFTFKAQLARA